MLLKRDIGDELMKQGLTKFIFIAENVLNFHSSDNEYYKEWAEELREETGWIIVLNMPPATQQDFIRKKLQYYMELMDLPEWRSYKPYHLFKKIDADMQMRLGG
jgi:ribosomal protein L30E